MVAARGPVLAGRVPCLLLACSVALAIQSAATGRDNDRGRKQK